VLPPDAFMAPQIPLRDPGGAGDSDEQRASGCRRCWECTNVGGCRR
jgi:hypothetical protein